MNTMHTLCVLCGQSGCCRHGITAMGRNDLLISLKTPESLVLVTTRKLKEISTHAPPELSDPAMTNIRGTIFLDRSNENKG